MMTRKLLFCLGALLIFTAYTPVSAAETVLVSTETGFTAADAGTSHTTRPKKKKASKKKKKPHCEAY